jgi:hypothetical protein
MTDPHVFPDTRSYRVNTLRASDARGRAERELARAGIALPFGQTTRWAQITRRGDGVLLIARDDAGNSVGALGALHLPNRSLPGHRTYRVERLAACSSPAVDALLVGELSELARNDRRCLAVIVELFERNDADRERLAELLRAQGFHRTSQPRTYERTVAMELVGSEEELFAKLARSARRNVREPAKRGLDLRPLTDSGLADRVHYLVTETFARTGGVAPRLPWADIIAWSTEEPRVSRMVGLFDGRTAGDHGLIAMAWGTANGRYATYELGASVRVPDLKNVPLNYALLWDLICWARRDTNASWFDLGGASSGADDDPLAGNLDFKRYFSQEIIPVGEEWHLEPHPLRAKVARAVGAVARVARRRGG